MLQSFTKKHLYITSFLLLAVSTMVSAGGFFTLQDFKNVFADDSITMAVYQDNGDGAVDNIRWTMDETVLACAYEAGDWTVDLGGDMNIVITGISCTGADAFLDIAVTADSFVTGSSSDPVISYVDQGNPFDVILSSGPMTDKLGVSASDNASPVLIPTFAIPNPQYLDPGFDGQIDLTHLYFTENVNYTYDDADWTEVVNNLTGYDIVGCSSCSDAFPLELLSTATFGITGVSGGTEPTLTFNASMGNITDAVGNAVVPFGPTSLVDEAAPVLVAALYLDPDFDAMVNLLRTTWSEAVTMSGSTSNDWLINPGDINVVFASAPDDATSGLTLDILVTADAGETGGAVNPDITYDNSDANDSIIDSPLAAPGGGSVAALDGAAPLITAATMLDGNANGIMDGISVTYSENLADTAAAANGFDLTSAVNHGACASESADPSGSSTLLLSFLCANVFTAVGDMTLGFTANAGIADAATNQSPSTVLTSVSTPAIADGAAPLVSALSMLDTNGDGILNRINLTYTEPLANTAAGANGFDVTSAVNHGACAMESADPAVSSSLQLNFLCTNVFTALGDLTLGFTANAGVVDTASNQSPTKTFTSSSTPAILDLASPVVVSWALDLALKLLTMNFSEAADASTLDATGVTVQDAATATMSVTLTGGTTASADGAAIVIDMLDADVTTIQGTSGLATSTANTFLTVTSAVMNDLLGNDVLAIVDGSALQASAVVVAPSSGGGRRRTDPTTFCGDGVVQAPNENAQNETCDDGNTTSGDGCSSVCVTESTSSGSSGGGSSHGSSPGPSPSPTPSPSLQPSPTPSPEPTPNVQKRTLRDISGDPERAAITRLFTAGYLEGNPNGNFEPKAFVRRAAAVKMISLLIGITPDQARKTDKWYSAMHRALINAKIIDGKISPDSFERRANLLAFVVKAKGLKIASLDACMERPFSDVVTTIWYCPVVQMAKNEGWLRERSGKLDPSGFATRSWAAGVLYRAFR